jgi:hypothetical protein
MSDLRKAAEMALERLESHEYWMDEEAIKALYAALPKRDWNGLTQEECEDLCAKYHEDKIVTVEKLLMVTDALLKEKNHGRI